VIRKLVGAGPASECQTVMRLGEPFTFRRISIALALLLALVIGWAAFERGRCRAAIARFQSVQRTQTRDEVHRLLGNPDQVLRGADVLSKRYWGSDVAVARNEGQVVRDERYAHDGLWGGYLIVIGYGADGSVQSKFLYD
jgi:hypothetical protein